MIREKIMTNELIYPGSEDLEFNSDTPPGLIPLDRPRAIIKADALRYFLWNVADLDKQQAFLSDFGMLTAEKTDDQLLMRGYGDDSYIYCAQKAKKTAFIGIGFSVNSRAELDVLAKATSQPIKPLNRMGGGVAVTLTDPLGLIIEVSFGIEVVKPVKTRNEVLPTNTPNKKVRVNAGQRPELTPSPVINAGHCVLGANNFEKNTQWYMEHLGLIPTDVMCLDDASHAIGFFRLDRGEQPADHHSLVFTKGLGNGYQHSAFELVDLDSLAQGQQYLKAKKRKHVWGLGRHILGSQIFDYWDDPWGFEYEHYADGDVYTADHPTEYHLLDIGNIYAWGEDLPLSYARPSFAQIKDTIVDLVKGEIKFSWLKQAGKGLSRRPRPWI
jgi:catechol 2,3-dioxygenase-like lactoylglutathione lyase family enzyme